MGRAGLGFVTYLTGWGRSRRGEAPSPDIIPPPGLTGESTVEGGNLKVLLHVLICSFLLSTLPFLLPVWFSPSRTSTQDLIGRWGWGADLDRQEVSVIAAAGHI